MALGLIALFWPVIQGGWTWLRARRHRMSSGRAAIRLMQPPIRVQLDS